jgi:hypothetical protein
MAFREYLGVFMKLFLDEFNVCNDFKTHLAKLWLCFDKYQKFGISLNLEKCMFLVYPWVILGYVVSKVRKLPNLKKISTIKNMPTPKRLKTYKFSMEWPKFINVSSRTLPPSLLPSQKNYAK